MRVTAVSHTLCSFCTFTCSPARSLRNPPSNHVLLRVTTRGAWGILGHLLDHANVISRHRRCDATACDGTVVHTVSPAIQLRKSRRSADASTCARTHSPPRLRSEGG